MNIQALSKQITDFENTCSSFLDKLSEEELQKLNAEPTILQIKAFNSIVSECKDEVKEAPIERMSSILKLLFDVDTEEFDIQNISKTMENFVNYKLNSFKNSESKLNSMKKIHQNIDHILNSLQHQYKDLQKESKKIYVFNGSKLKTIKSLAIRLNELKQNIRLQMEYDAKAISNDIIKDFYNIYIFFLFLSYMTIAQEEELLSIEIVNEIDRFVKVIELVFNGRTLKNQDMLYYYAIYELNELKNIIYSHISKTDEI